MTTIPTSDQPAVPDIAEPVTGSTVSVRGETAVERRAAVVDRLSSDWTFLTGDDTSAHAAIKPVESTPKASAVVLSWLVDRDSKGPSMAMLSPIVVALTIWDAAASAGSGLAAPASALGTFVLLVLFEKGHVVNGARLLRRRSEI